MAKEGYAGLLLVHSETSTGALADLPALARAFKEKNPEGLVGADMVTSLLVGEVAAGPWAWTPRPRGARRASCAPRASASWPSPQGPGAPEAQGLLPGPRPGAQGPKGGESAWTPAINLVLAVAAVLEEVLPRLEEHLALKAWQNALLYGVGEEGGLRPVPKRFSPAVAAFYLPEGVPYARVKEAFAQRGAVIAGGRGP